MSVLCSVIQGQLKASPDFHSEEALLKMLVLGRVWRRSATARGELLLISSSACGHIFRERWMRGGKARESVVKLRWTRFRGSGIIGQGVIWKKGVVRRGVSELRCIVRLRWMISSGRGGRDPEVFSGQEVSSGRGGRDSEGVVSSGKVLSGREVLSGEVLSR